MQIKKLAQNYLEEKFRIGSFDIDLHGNAKLTALCNFLQEIAGRHAALMERGMQDLLEENLAWVLSRLQLKIYKSPQWNDTICIRTWPVGLDGIFAIRDFQIYSHERELLAEASSAWLVLNRLNRRPVRPHAIVEKMNYHGNPRIFDNSISKIPAMELTEPIHSHTVRFSDLDLNHHVNNVKYIKWITDACPDDVHLHQRICEMEINFLHESRLGEQLAIHCKTVEANSFHCSILNKDKAFESCRAILKWTEK